jgi:DNA-binding NtrC family response regulator
VSEETRTRTLSLASHLAREGGVARLAHHRQRFEVRAGRDAGLTREIEAPRVRIGTASHGELVLTDDSVSGHHCEVSVRGERYVVRDLGSTNGTTVDGVAVVEAYLHPGAVLGLGETEIVFHGHRSWEPVGASPELRFGELVGGSPVMRELFGVLLRVAPTSLGLLLLGETGTGKDVAARSVHAASDRSGGPFVVVDCGALHANLVESQLFGHERGAFTGAEKARKGAFERADRGTVFLDEIGELPLELQPRLLRVLERQEVEPLGAHEPIAVDVRVIAATHRDLPAMVERGEFREDLFYRLAEVTVALPPLREHPEDVPLLARTLLAQTPGAHPELSDDALAWLAAQPWPGNVRELRNAVRRAALLGGTAVLDRRAFEQQTRIARSIPPAAAPPSLPVHAELPIREARERWMEALERSYVTEVFARHGGDVGAIAAHMRLHRKSVYRLLRQHGLIDDD